MKKIIISIGLLALIGLSGKVQGQSGTTGPLTWALSGLPPNYTLTISGSGAMPNYSYDAPWYTYRSDIATVIIGSGVTSIGVAAFGDCSSLTSVNIGNSVTSIGVVAFYNCSGLTSITIPNSVTSIGDRAFSSCSGLTSVSIGNSVTSIGIVAFYDCSGLTSISVDIGNPRYSSNNGILYSKLQDTLVCFPGGKIGTFTIPHSVTSIGNFAFYYCNSLTSVTIPDDVITIGNEAFGYCTSLQIVNYNAINCTTMGDGYSSVFFLCNAFTTLNIGNNVKIIPANAFYDCRGLTSVTIPNSVTSIGNYAFLRCSGLTSVTIGNSVTSIGSDAFYGCSGLTFITTFAIIPPALGSNAFQSVPMNIPIYIPCGTYNDYSSSLSWSYFSNFIEITEDTTFYTANCYFPYTDDNFTMLTTAGVHYSGNCDSLICLTLIEKPVPQLCMISVDENNHNELVWKHEEDVVSYNLYREGDVGGQYDLIATINSQNLWTDTASDAKIRSYRYKISGIDTCGQESALSTEHKTMHLTINAGVNNSWNLIWTAYEGTQYATYNIYRTTDSTLTNWTLISTMPSGNPTSTYSDFTAPVGGYIYYMVEIMLDEPCVLHKSLSSIKSNVASNNPNVGVVETDNYPSLPRIYPNPANDKLFIECESFVTVKIYDMLGKEILIQNANGKTEINISHLPNGIYSVRVFSEDKIIGNGKIVKQ